MADQLSAINHIVVLMLENRSFHHMLSLLYSANGNVSPAGQPFDGLTGNESNPGTDGSSVAVFQIAAAQPNAADSRRLLCITQRTRLESNAADRYV